MVTAGVFGTGNSSGAGEPAITLAAPTFYDAFNYTDGTRLIAGDPNANAGLVATNPGNLGWDALTSAAASNARFTPIIFENRLRNRTANSSGDFSSPGTYLLSPSTTQSGEQYIEIEVSPLADNDMTPSGSILGTDQNNLLSVQVTGAAGGTGSASIAQTVTGTPTTLVSAAPFAGRVRMGGINGQYALFTASEKLTLIYNNGRAYLRRAPGFPLGATTGGAVTGLSGNRFGVRTFYKRYQYVDGIKVGPAPLLLVLDETYKRWVPKVLASAGASRSTGMGRCTFTGTYGSTAPTRLQWALYNLATGALLKDWAWVPIADQTIGGGTWSVDLKNIPAGLNGRGAYAPAFRPVAADGTTDTSWQVVGNKEFFVTLNIGILGQSNGAYVGNTTSGAAHPRIDGLLDYKKADPPSVVQGFHGVSSQFWDDAAAAASNNYYLLANALANYYNVPVSCETLAIAARSALALGPNGVDWSYIQTHHAFAGNAYELLYLSQGENEFVAEGSLWLSRWTDNIAAYRAMSGQPPGTVIPVYHAFTGRHTGVTSDSLVSTKATREGQEALASTVADVIRSHHYVGITMVDSYHYTTANTQGYSEAMRRNALSIMKHITGTGYDGMGPLATTATRVGAVITVAFDLNGAASMAARNGEDQNSASSATALTSWEVSADDFATTLTITSAELVGNDVVITLAANPGASVKVRNHYGFQPNVTSWAAGSYADGTFICSKPIIIPLVTT